MPSLISIYNAALLEIGERTILAPEDVTTSAAARVLNASYSTALEETLRQHPWNCATSRQVLNADATAPAYGWAKRFPLPADCLRVTSVSPEGSKWSVEGRYLMSNESTVSITYVAQMTDPSQMDSLLARCVSLRLASLICRNLTGSNDMAQEVFQKWNIALDDARYIDAMERHGDQHIPEEMNLGRLVTVSPLRTTEGM